jgi:hypothetical protein
MIDKDYPEMFLNFQNDQQKSTNFVVRVTKPLCECIEATSGQPNEQKIPCPMLLKAKMFVVVTVAINLNEKLCNGVM